MDAGIGSAGTGKLKPPSQQQGNGVLNFLLNSQAIWLNLPSVKSGSVEIKSDKKSVTDHCMQKYEEAKSCNLTIQYKSPDRVNV